MKLDPRIEKDTLIYTPYSLADNRTTVILHDRGYFTDDISDFGDLDLCSYGELVEVSPDGDSPYARLRKNSSLVEWCQFYLPEGSLKPAEKKYRPYTFMEFQDKFTVGRPIKFREKRKFGCERYLILNGYQHEQKEGRPITYIYIGSQGYTLDALFMDYEWQEHYTEDFKPFGTEVTE